MDDLLDQVREHCAAVAGAARHVAIDPDRLGAVEPAPPPALDPERHYLEGPPEDVARYLLTLDAVNFGSGWFPTLRKRPGSLGLLHRGLGTGRPLPRRRPVVQLRAAGGRAGRAGPRSSGRTPATS